MLPVIGAAQDREDDIDESQPVDDSTVDDDSTDVDERDVDGRDADGEGAEGSEADETDVGPITVRNYSDENPPAPAAPELGAMEEGEQMEVAENAGVGSPLGYARATVLEVGGALGLGHQSVTTQFSISPNIGYFIVDGLQLTLFARFNLTHVSGGDDPTSQSQTDVAFATVLEPSYHVSITDEFFLFAGAGVGAMFSRDPAADFLFRPRVGADLLIGRSSIFKPAVFVDIGAIDGFAGFGVEGAFTAIF